jgi:hypothetical protein
MYKQENGRFPDVLRRYALPASKYGLLNNRWARLTTRGGYDGDPRHPMTAATAPVQTHSGDPDLVILN